MSQHSIYLDIGHGEGRTCISLANCVDGPGMSIGFDVESAQLFNSMRNLSKYEKKQGRRVLKPIVLLQLNMDHIRCLDPATHAYTFLGYWGLLPSIVTAMSMSTTVVVWILITPRAMEKQLHDLGVHRFSVLYGIKMAGSGCRAFGYVIKLGATVREEMRAALGRLPPVPRAPDQEPRDVDLRRAVEGCDMQAQHAAAIYAHAHARDCTCMPLGSEITALRLLNCMRFFEKDARNIMKEKQNCSNGRSATILEPTGQLCLARTQKKRRHSEEFNHSEEFRFAAKANKRARTNLLFPWEREHPSYCKGFWTNARPSPKWCGHCKLPHDECRCCC